MQTKTLTLTPEDLALAQVDFANTRLMSQCCLLFQAAKREGLNPKEMDFYAITCHDGTEWALDPIGNFVAHRGSSEWAEMVGRTVTLTLLEAE